MGKITGFLEHRRARPPERDPTSRIADWEELHERFADPALRGQASRCMDCGVPFCHVGCPLGNLIPDWNHLIYLGRWREALDRLHATHNFPEITGRICPAPCEDACVLTINDEAVTIKQVELCIVDRGFEEGWISPEPPEAETGRRVAIVGSGPAGLAAAQQLRRLGHGVDLFDRDDRLGGLLRYGIPGFKLGKERLQRRLDQIEAEGVVFHPGVEVGADLPAEDLLRDFDALLLALGAHRPRDLDIPGRDLLGVHFAMPYLVQQNRACEGDAIEASDRIHARDRAVVVIGGGDTGADCVATALRQGARQVVQLEHKERPPGRRPPDTPWPAVPRVFKVTYAQREGGRVSFALEAQRFVGKGDRVRAVELAKVRLRHEEGRRIFEPIDDKRFELEADLVLLAMGYRGPERAGPIEELGLELDPRGNLRTDPRQMTSVEGIFAAGDARVGQSLVVTAIAEGREAARHIHDFLRDGSPSGRDE